MIAIFATGMQLKDYYAILGLEPPVNTPEIRKAYRKLAMLLHPDKNPGDPYARSRFEEIREAYEVLTNPAKKEHYLQQRWYHRHAGSRQPAPPVTPVSFLKQVLELDKYVSQLDQFRMNQKGLQDYLLELLEDHRIQQLNGFREISTNDEIISILLRCLKSLSFPMLQQPLEQLRRIDASPARIEMINSYAISREKSNHWERYTPWILFLVVIIICMLIFVAAQ